MAVNDYDLMNSDIICHRTVSADSPATPLPPHDHYSMPPPSMNDTFSELCGAQSVKTKLNLNLTLKKIGSIYASSRKDPDSGNTVRPECIQQQ